MIEIKAFDPMGTQWSTTDTDAIHVIDQKTGRCSWCAGTGHTAQGYRDCARCQGTGRIAETPTEPESPWIDPVDRVPAIGECVLICYECKWPTIRLFYTGGYYGNQDGSICFMDSIGTTIDGDRELIGWMPIPRHPRDKP